MKKVLLGITLGIVIWISVNCMFYYNRMGIITLDALWIQSRPALAGGFFLFVLYLLVRKIKK